MRQLPLPKFPIEGGCRCGQVRFRIDEPPLLEVACHCRGCQRMTASAFSTSIAVPEAAFAIIAGEPVRGGLGEGEADHRHCGTCLSWIYTSFPPALGFVNVRPTLLDDPSWHAPWLEVETGSKLPWVQTGAERSFEGSPAAGEYMGFIAEYRSARGIT